MSRTIAIGLAFTLSAMSVSVTARADEPQKQASNAIATDDDGLDKTTAAFLVGSALALVPFAIGTTITTTSTDGYTQNAGVVTLQGGLAIAPFVAHAMVGEWGRAALWSVLPVGASIGMLSLLQVDPDAVTHTSLEVQRLYYSLVVTSVVVGALGVADVLRAPIRERERNARARHAISIVPMFTPGAYGLALGGSL